MLLTVKNLSKSFGKQQVLNDISFDLKEGSLLAVLGPSGCGKTTLLRCLAGFEQVDQGEISLDGQDMLNLPAQDRPISTVFQSFGLFPHLNVADNITYGLRIAGVRKPERQERVAAIAKTVGLTQYLQARIQDLSGGQQQRVALARSLVIAPRLLLLDEPFSSLDRRLRLAMREEVKDIQRQTGVTTILVTHDQEEAFAMADRILLLDAGRIQQIGRGPDLYEEPENSFVLDFIGQVNHLKDGSYVRPEAIHLSATAQANYREAEVVERHYYGPARSYLLAGESDRLWVQVLAADDPELQVGDKVYYYMQPQSLSR
ncbi:ABC transporter ATP-binding protein [Aerococcus sp. UMB7834]|uniref:ABC transporter ATP-binding protein n=1 Tax=Aerococcus sp. UMB7834 TaxID=3046342 RepID=UPI0025512936|nr:ABC transporter ATP-binding protein [Aerococcus sp. UMB7834]MDK6805858.1 ABC transporter ATP-binding protein [Aerococcus sp. UMB7834]